MRNSIKNVAVICWAHMGACIHIRSEAVSTMAKLVICMRVYPSTTRGIKQQQRQQKPKEEVQSQVIEEPTAANVYSHNTHKTHNSVYRAENKRQLPYAQRTNTRSAYAWSSGSNSNRSI